MAISQNELQSIINAVLSTIRTNSRTIGQLTPVTTLSDKDSFEIDGGKRVAFEVLKESLKAIITDDLDTLKASLGKIQKIVMYNSPVRCADEADLAAKAASDDYPVGQQFYIPETE